MGKGFKVLFGFIAGIFVLVALVGFVIAGAAIAFRFGPVVIPVVLIVWWLYNEGKKAEMQEKASQEKKEDGS